MAADWGGGGVGEVADAADVSVKHHHQHGADEIHHPLEKARRVEVITSQRRRSWGREEKAAITAESFAIGANVSEVARRHSVSVGLLHYWRRKAREPAQPSGMSFVPVLPQTGSGPLELPGGGSIQIDYAGARIRVNGPVDPAALEAVLSTLRKQS